MRRSRACFWASGVWGAKQVAHAGQRPQRQQRNVNCCSAGDSKPRSRRREGDPWMIRLPTCCASRDGGVVARLSPFASLHRSIRRGACTERRQVRARGGLLDLESRGVSWLDRSKLFIRRCLARRAHVCGQVSAAVHALHGVGPAILRPPTSISIDFNQQWTEGVGCPGWRVDVWITDH